MPTGLRCINIFFEVGFGISVVKSPFLSLFANRSFHHKKKLPENLKTSLERPWYNRKHGIRMDLREEGWECVDWMHLALDRDRWRALVNMIMNLLVP
jgi:hypothetical protein